MTNFFLYYFFGSIEYLGIIALTFTLFKYKMRNYKLPILYLLFALVTMSYVLVIFNLFRFIPIPFISIIIITLFFRFFMDCKWLLSLLISVGGNVLFAVIQIILVAISIQTTYVKSDELQITFSTKSYLMQVICSSIVFLMCYYINWYNQGFGLTLRKTEKLYKSILPSFVSLLTTFLLFYIYILTDNIIVFALFGIVTIITIVALIIFLRKRGKMDFKD